MTRKSEATRLPANFNYSDRLKVKTCKSNDFNIITLLDFRSPGLTLRETYSCVLLFVPPLFITVVLKCKHLEPNRYTGSVQTHLSFTYYRVHQIVSPTPYLGECHTKCRHLPFVGVFE